jgi:hypothetical protein
MRRCFCEAIISTTANGGVDVKTIPTYQRPAQRTPGKGQRQTAQPSMKVRKQGQAALAVDAQARADPLAEDYRRRFEELVARANQGNVEAQRRLREFLDGHPEIWEKVGDLTALTERTWIELIARGDQLLEESLRCRVKQLKAELAGARPSQIESILADLIASSWLGLQFAEMQTARGGTVTAEQVWTRLKRIDSSHKRYLNSLKTLAMLRSAMPGGLVPAGHLRAYDPGPQAAV